MFILVKDTEYKVKKCYKCKSKLIYNEDDIIKIGYCYGTELAIKCPICNTLNPLSVFDKKI